MISSVSQEAATRRLPSSGRSQNTRQAPAFWPAKTAGDVFVRAVSTPKSVRFLGAEEKEYAPTRTFQVTTKTGRVLDIRQWWAKGANPDALPKKGVPILIVPGLGGTTAFATPFISQFVDQHPLIYGIDTRCFGADSASKGHLADRRELVRELHDAITWLKEKHGGNVYVAGISLGALAVTHMAADKPDHVAGVVLINPAFRPASSSFKPLFYAKTFVKFLLEKVGLRKPSPVAMPYGDDSDGQADMEWMREARTQISAVTATTMYQLMMMTFFESLKKAAKVKLPTMMIVGGKDKICDPATMRKGFGRIPATDKKLVEYPDSHHNIIFEPDMVKMAEELTHWLKPRIKAEEAKLG